MQHNLKFHAIAIGSICLIVIVLFLIMRPNTDAPAEVSPYATGDRYVRVESATWGLNCNQEINRLRQSSQKTDADDQPYHTATLNNVALQVGELCNGRLVCDFNADATTLQEDPLTSCYKQLEISYRCFSIDRLWRLTFNQGDNAHIDCNPSADASRK